MDPSLTPSVRIWHVESTYVDMCSLDLKSNRLPDGWRLEQMELHLNYGGTSEASWDS